MYACTMYMQLLWKPKEGVRSPRTGATDGSEPPDGCWKQNLGPLQESGGP